MYLGTYVTPNVKQENNNYIPFSLVNINFDYPDEFLDKRIIHELNHVYELNLVSVNEKVRIIQVYGKLCMKMLIPKMNYCH